MFFANIGSDWPTSSKNDEVRAHLLQAMSRNAGVQALDAGTRLLRFIYRLELGNEFSIYSFDRYKKSTIRKFRKSSNSLLELSETVPANLHLKVDRSLLRVAGADESADRYLAEGSFFAQIRSYNPTSYTGRMNARSEISTLSTLMGRICEIVSELDIGQNDRVKARIVAKASMYWDESTRKSIDKIKSEGSGANAFH